jgi:hypothetical protein
MEVLFGNIFIAENKMPEFACHSSNAAPGQPT